MYNQIQINKDIVSWERFKSFIIEFYATNQSKSTFTLTNFYQNKLKTTTKPGRGSSGGSGGGSGGATGPTSGAGPSRYKEVRFKDTKRRTSNEEEKEEKN